MNCVGRTTPCLGSGQCYTVLQSGFTLVGFGQSEFYVSILGRMNWLTFSIGYKWILRKVFTDLGRA